MIVHNIKTQCGEGDPHFRFLCSDLHLGSANSDHDAILADMERAKAAGARILINGDVFDAICPTDKRFDAEALHPDVMGEKDLAGAIVQLACSLLFPYAHLIDVIGIGNHEETWIKYNHSDPVRLLINTLNDATGSKIRHGAFSGYINTTFTVDGYRGKVTHRLRYYHGTGGDSPVTKGTIDFARQGRNWQYDTLTFGHKHNLAVTGEQIADSVSGRYTERLQLNIQTASYFRNYRSTEEGDPLAYSYAESKAHPPKPVGGTFLILRPVACDDGKLAIKQDYASDVFFRKPRKRTA